MKVIANFEGDFARKRLRGYLLSEGHQLPGRMDADRVYSVFGHYLERVPVKQPRTVYVNSSLVCPPRLRTGFESFLEVLEAGGDLRPYMSRTAYKLDYKDMMLLDWGIHHFHLGDAPDRRDPRSVKRTGPLAFVRIENTAAYVIDVLGHGDWANVDVLSKLDQEWPALLEPWRLRGVVGISGPAEDPKTRMKLRNAGIIQPVEINGKYYIAPGPGITTARTSVATRRRSDYWHRVLRQWQTYCEANVLRWREVLRDLGHRSLGSTCRLELHFEGQFVFAKEVGVENALWPLGTL